MITERFTITLTCLRKECALYLSPVDVDMIREGSTGAQVLVRDADEFCECGERREEAIEGGPDQVRRRTVEVSA